MGGFCSPGPWGQFGYCKRIRLTSATSHLDPSTLTRERVDIASAWTRRRGAGARVPRCTGVWVNVGASVSLPKRRTAGVFFDEADDLFGVARRKLVLVEEFLRADPGVL